MAKAINNPEAVKKYMSELKHPFKKEIEAIRKLIKNCNNAITEEIKWNAPSYGYKGEYLVTFNLRETKRIHLVFHNPQIAKIMNNILEGDYKDRRMTYFADMDDVKSKQKELERVIKELISKL